MVARYTLFEDAFEFQLFFDQLKQYIAPVVIMLSVMLLSGVVVVAVKKVDKLHQEKLATGFFWFSSILLVLAFAAVFANVKLRDGQSSDQSSRSVAIP